MSIGDLLGIHPTELKFPFVWKKTSSCSIQLSNKTDHYVAFKVKTTKPKLYTARPTVGIVSPRSLCCILVTMNAPKKAPSDMMCSDKFMVQSVIAPPGTTTAKDLPDKMFDKEGGKLVEEFKLRVVYVPANRPPTVPEGDEEGTSSDEDEIRKPLCSTRSVVLKLKVEKASIEEENQKLLEELELLTKSMERRRRRRISPLILFSISVSFIGGVSIGYMISYP